MADLKFPKVVFLVLSIDVLFHVYMSFKQIYHFKMIKRSTLPVYIISIPLIWCLADSHVGYCRLYLALEVFTCMMMGAYSVVVTKTLNISSSLQYMAHTSLYFFARPLEHLSIALVGSHLIFPEQKESFQYFMSFYWWICRCVGLPLGDTIGRYIEVRSSCFGRPTCPEACIYWAFGITVVMVLLLAGFYRKLRKYVPEENYHKKVFQMAKCAYKNWSKDKSKSGKDFLDYAIPKFDRDFVDDIKKLKFHMLLFLPSTIVFYSDIMLLHHLPDLVLDLKWGDIPAKYIYIFSEFLYNICMFLATPVLECIIYPMLTRRELLVSNMDRFILGLFFLLLSGISSVILLNKIESEKLTFEDPPNLRIFNAMECDLRIGYLVDQPIYISYTSSYHQRVRLKNNKEDFIFNYQCGKYKGKGVVILKKGSTAGLYIKEPGHFVQFLDKSLKVIKGNPLVRFIDDVEELYYYNLHNRDFNYSIPSMNMMEVFHGEYEIKVNGVDLGNKLFELGGIYVILVHFKSNNRTYSNMVRLKKANSYHIFWVLPQCILCAFGTTMALVSMGKMAYLKSPVSIRCTGYGICLASELVAINIFQFNQSYITESITSINYGIYCCCVLTTAVATIAVTFKFKDTINRTIDYRM